MGNRNFAAGFGRDAVGDIAFRQRRAEPIGVVALVGEKLPGPGHDRQHQRRALAIAHLPFA